MSDDRQPDATPQDPDELVDTEPGSDGSTAAAEDSSDHHADGADPDAVAEAEIDWEALAAADDRTPGQVLAALVQASREREDYLDGLRRKQAEFENFRKRMMREGAAQRIAGHAEVAERLLDVLDDFDRTLDAAGDVDPGFRKGVELVHDKLVQILRDFGLTRIDDVGTTFDPNRHEAVQQVAAEDEVDEPVVTEVLRPGYELGGRVLRAAMVVVAQ